MPTTPAPGDTTARTIEDRFLDLICSDADLLAAEFDAIIAAQWPEPPTATPGRGAVGRHPGSNAARRVADPARGHVARPPQPGIGGSARQRSPPPPHPTHDRQKGMLRRWGTVAIVARSRPQRRASG